MNSNIRAIARCYSSSPVRTARPRRGPGPSLNGIVLQHTNSCEDRAGLVLRGLRDLRSSSVRTSTAVMDVAFSNSSSTLVFFVNGKKVIDNNVDPEWTLLYYLREKLRLCGTKLGCAEGGCGACTVMVSKYNHSTKEILNYAVNACLAPVCSMHGLAVVTVEGIGNTRKRLHAVQERIAKSHGSQCGFCTPGIVMSMYALLRNKNKPHIDDLEEAFQGNLCRCTGYRPLIEGFSSFIEGWEQTRTQNGVESCQMGKYCCKNDVNGYSEEEEKLVDKSKFVPYDPTLEPIFPPDLQLSSCLNEEFLVIKGKRVTWYRPTNIKDLLTLKAKFPDARIIVGNTEVGVEVKFKNCNYPILIQPTQIPEMVSVKKLNDGIYIGASVTLNEIDTLLREELKAQPVHKIRIFKSIVEMLHWFAGKQIRNVACVGGNIMTGSPISDLNPIFLAANCELELMSQERGSRKITMDDKFYTGYRRTIVKPDEILVGIKIPYSLQDQYFFAYKQAKRRDDDIAIVNCAVNVLFENSTSIIKDITVAFGGMAPTTQLPVRMKETLIGKKWNEEMLHEANQCLIQELPLSPTAPGGMIQYRRTLTLSFFFKAYLNILQQLSKQLPSDEVPSIPNNYCSATSGFHTLTPKSSQYFQKASSEQTETDLVGRSIPHKSADKQATGEAVYIDDIPHFERELYLSLVFSSRAHAQIVSIDASKAVQLEGVHDFFSSKDIPKGFKWGPVLHDEEVFASEKVTCFGQVIGAIVANDQMTAQRAAKLVEVQYKDLEPPIITIPDAIEKKSFFNEIPKEIVSGNIEEAFSNADNIITGEVRIGGQEHFYLETQATIVVPKGEDDEMEILCSTQHPTEIQKLVAEFLGVPFNRIVCRVKRMGGGFGGKESRGPLVALPCALAAHRLNRPIRCMLDRDEDMVITGQRHPFLAKYKVAFTKDGVITGCDIQIYSNAGHTLDLSYSIVERAMFHFNNAYKIPNVRCQGYVCKTNLPSNTAFRGFGGPQGMFFAETIIRHVAEELKVDPVKIAQMNLYKEGDLTHYGQILERCTLPRCWEECLVKSDYYNRKKSVDVFNKENRWKKRGMSMVPTMFGISFTAAFLNQAGALIHVYTDGSVLISHGGTEMGQGLHTKMIQVASRALGISDSYIHISETSTDKVPNTSATAASASSDLNGMAILNACNIILKRLEPVKSENPKGSWKDWVQAAYFKRISLSATGFYCTPNIGYDLKTYKGNVFNYYTFGASCSEVEIDCLTGDHQVLRTDIVMDLGESINPAIDIGQIEGGFVQGYGLFTLEEVVVSPTGMLYSRGPGMYKIPGFADIPAEFNVSLLKGASNPRAVYSSKAVGEPPLFLASSTFFAIKEAISSARKDGGASTEFRLDSPATAARIRMSCLDDITRKFPEPDPKCYVPWNVIP